MSEQEKRSIVKSIDEMTDEQKLMTLGFVKGLAAVKSAEKPEEKKEE